MTTPFPARRPLAAAPLVLGAALDSAGALTARVSGAVDRLRAAGTLKALETEWLASAGTAPELR